MNKQEFLSALAGRLSSLPHEDIDERISFYSEMIDERMDEGIAEEDAILEIGSAEEIALQIRAEIPGAKAANNTVRRGKALRAWEIVLLVLGSPVWLSLLISAFAVAFSLYISLWSVIVSFWAVEVSLWCAALGGIAGGTAILIFGERFSGFALMGLGIACAGLSVFLFFGCAAATKLAWWLTKKAVLGIKRCFTKRGERDA